jgi:hypothetical protein
MTYYRTPPMRHIRDRTGCRSHGDRANSAPPSPNSIGGGNPVMDGIGACERVFGQRGSGQRLPCAR